MVFFVRLASRKTIFHFRMIRIKYVSKVSEFIIELPIKEGHLHSFFNIQTAEKVKIGTFSELFQATLGQKYLRPKYSYTFFCLFQNMIALKEKNILKKVENR